jgi:tetratricopeptide (TPR) repeat protein
MKPQQLLIWIFGFTYPLAAFAQQTSSGIGEAIKRARELYNQAVQQASPASPDEASANRREALRQAKEFFAKQPTPQPAADLNKSSFDKYLMSDYDGAIADYTKAIELNPKYVEAYCNRGTAELGKSDYDGAYRA